MSEISILPWRSVSCLWPEYTFSMKTGKQKTLEERMDKNVSEKSLIIRKYEKYARGFYSIQKSEKWNSFLM